MTNRYYEHLLTHANKSQLPHLLCDHQYGTSRRNIICDHAASVSICLYYDDQPLLRVSTIVTETMLFV
jgi:hypothetical protein